MELIEGDLYRNMYTKEVVILEHREFEYHSPPMLEFSDAYGKVHRMQIERFKAFYEPMPKQKILNDGR